MKRLLIYLRFDWPLHFILLLTNWLPDNVIFLRLRGLLARPFLGSCGHALNIGRNVDLYNPSLIHLGNYVHLAFGVALMAIDHIWIEDEVMIGPYCVLVSANHTRHEGSFRFGTSEVRPIWIGCGSWLGSHVVVTAGGSVGRGAVIAAGGVVSSEIPDNVMAGGLPAREIKELSED